MADAHDEIVEHVKNIAAALALHEATVRREMHLHPDPLPAKRLRGGKVWARRSRLPLWKRRRYAAEHPVPGLALVSGWVRIAGVVRLTASRAQHLAPWASPAPRCPLPVWRDVEGRVHAYRDALIDYLDLVSEPVSQGGLLRRDARASEKRKRGTR